MDKFINAELHSGSELDALLVCCNMRARQAGYLSWRDPNLASALKQTIIHACIETCGFPVVLCGD